MMESSQSVFKRPWLWLPSQLAHDLAPYSLPLISRFVSVKNKSYRPWQWRGLHFLNPLGVAGGVDKTGQSLEAWQNLGAGFLEVGTVTPEPQGPNPGKIMDRDVLKSALWNKMGFPNPGAEALARRLENFKNKSVPLFINIGKNRWTKNEEAHQDYSHCLRKLHPYADAFVVNLSSPNTEGLRDLLTENQLQSFLSKLRGTAKEVAPTIPLILKLSPDMDEATLRMALAESLPLIDGWILTNTTKSRYPQCPFPPDQGGVSGEPLRELSLSALKIAAEYKKKNPEKLLVSVGGVGDASEIKNRLNLGADLVQSYSSLVFAGPRYFQKVLKDLQS